VGGFLDWSAQPTNIDETSIATATKSLIFTTVINCHYGVQPGSAYRNRFLDRRQPPDSTQSVAPLAGDDQQRNRQQHGDREESCLPDCGYCREVIQVHDVKDQMRDGEQQVSD
jgi:hypothetical protein